MNRRILERRLEMLEYAFSGVRYSKWTPIIAEKHGVSESAICSDWGRRGRWLSQLFMLDKSAFKLSELMGRLELALTKGFALMLTTTDERVRISSMNTIGSLSKAMFDIGSQAGVYPSLLRDILDKLVSLEEELE